MADMHRGAALLLLLGVPADRLVVIVLGGELQPSIKCVVKEIALHSVTVREMFPFNL